MLSSQDFKTLVVLKPTTTADATKLQTTRTPGMLATASMVTTIMTMIMTEL
jgi:hypothetical protein